MKLNNIYICPYCGASGSAKKKYTSWKAVSSHVKSCTKDTGEYVVSSTDGPIHYSYYLENTRDQIVAKFSKSRYSDMLDKFRLLGYLQIDNTKKYTREECIAAIVSKAKELGRTPKNADFRKTEGKYPCIQYLVKEFGSWNLALIASGFELHKKSELYCTPTIGLDGHQYRSKAEAYFADTFLFGKYEYNIEPSYPINYNKFYDWYIPTLDLYIELDGNLRPLVTTEKIKINNMLNRACLFIPTNCIKNSNKINLIDFKEYNNNEALDPFNPVC